MIIKCPKASSLNFIMFLNMHSTNKLHSRMYPFQDPVWIFKRLRGSLRTKSWMKFTSYKPHKPLFCPLQYNKPSPKLCSYEKIFAGIVRTHAFSGDDNLNSGKYLTKSCILTLSGSCYEPFAPSHPYLTKGNTYTAPSSRILPCHLVLYSDP